MKLKLISDIHLEFGDYVIEPMPEDKDTVLILAGDITVINSTSTTKLFKKFIAKASEQFRYVIMVAGNHEFYKTAAVGCAMHDAYKELFDQTTKQNRKVILLQDQSYRIDDVVFIGSTLWTDCGTLEAADPKAQYLWHGMTDAKAIKYEDNPQFRGMTVGNCRTEFLRSRDFIINEVANAQSEGYKTVVITHHLPSYKSVHPDYLKPEFASMNKFFASDMDLDIEFSAINLWVHGHTHNACDYVLGDTRIVCNPRGYHGYENKPELRGFDPHKIIGV